MHCLVVTAHPLKESLCSSIALGVVEMLRAAGHGVKVLDLYDARFDAVMTASERASYYTDTYAAESVAAQIEELRSAEAVVLIFPTWWFGLPAILKGWFDRVWAPGVAYDHSPGFGPIKPRLGNLREMLVVTSLGAAWWVDCLIMRQPVKRIFKTAIVGACAPKCRFKMVSMYKAEQLSSERVDRFLSRIKRALSKWRAQIR